MVHLTQNNLYTLALTVGLTATIIYGLLSLCIMNIDSPKHQGYNLAQRIKGTTLLIWALHIIVHLLLNIRYTDNYLATTISLSSYSILISGLELTFHALLDVSYYSKRRLRATTMRCIIYCALLCLNYLFTPQSLKQWSIVALSIPLTYIITQAAYRAIKRYREVKRNIDNYYSDDTSESVEWLRYSLYIMLALGFACLVIPYGTALSDTSTMIVAICALTYVEVSMRNYAVRINAIYKNVETTPAEELTTSEERAPRLSDSKTQILESRLDEWIKGEKFLKPNITMDDLAEEVNSNRRYISEYLNDKLDLTFKSWIAQLKIEYSKSLLLDQTHNYTSIQVAEVIGYSRSNYNKTFAKLTGKSPSEFRNSEGNSFRQKKS